MSASNCPETPRQKMIQMLYLVYTAMLALNVSAEVLNGFVTVGDAMNKSNTSLQEKLNDSYETFQKAHENNPAKTDEAYKKAQEVKKLSEELELYIDSLESGFLCMLQSSATLASHTTEGTGDNAKVITTKRDIPLRNDGPANEPSSWLIDSARYALDNFGLAVIGKPDDNNNGTIFFLKSNTSQDYDHPADDTRAIILKNRIIQYKKKLKEILGADSASVPLALNVEGEYYSSHAGHMVNWEQQNFNNTISIAVMVVLARMKAEVMTAEYDVVKMLYNKIGADDFKFDKIAYVVKPTGSSYVIKGGKYEAEVRIAAYDSRTPFSVTTGGGRKTSEEGVVIVQGNTSSAGPQKIKGSIYVSNDGVETAYDFEEEYYVAEPTAVVELTKMNVVYPGIDNPLSISAPGLAASDLDIRVTEGQATITHKVGSEYELQTKAKVGSKIKTEVRTKDGRLLKNSEFRVKPLPTPRVTLGPIKSGKQISKQDLAAVERLQLTYGQDFAYDIKAPAVKGWEASSGNKPLGTSADKTEFLNNIKKLKPGEKVEFTVRFKNEQGEDDETYGRFKIKR